MTGSSEDRRPIQFPSSLENEGPRRVLVISERWERNADEGMLVLLEALGKNFDRESKLLVLHDHGETDPSIPMRRVPMGKGLLSPALLTEIRHFAPDLVLYCPTACATTMALWRCHRLARAVDAAPVALLSLQRRSYRAWELPLVRRLRPWCLVVLSEQQRKFYENLGFSVLAMPAGVDLEKFHPTDTSGQKRLRRELSLPESEEIVLHVGHLQPGRNLESLGKLSQPGRRSVVVVASTANPADASVRARLESTGVVVRHEYIANIGDYYRAADAYVFPVVSAGASIETPLSVLEAMATDLPVLTTRFGSLSERFEAGQGLRWIEADTDLRAALSELMTDECDNRTKVARFSWQSSVAVLTAALLGAKR